MTYNYYYQLVIIRDEETAFDAFCCFITGFFLATNDRHGHSLELLKFAVKQLEMV